MKTIHALLLAALALAIGACAPTPTRTTPTPTNQAPPAQPAEQELSFEARTAAADPFVWLEKVHGERAMNWVDEQNAISEKRFASGALFEDIQGDILEVMNSDARIPWPEVMGDYIYNFWRGAEHPRGIWRRTTLEQYRSDSPDWETVLDVDALGKADGHPWVFKGAQCLEPDYRRCLISLSPKGGDAVVVREFDTVSKRFIEDGFKLPLSKTSVSWINGNHIFVGTDFGPGAMTESTYPRIVKKWTRGTPLTAAKTIYEGKPSDLAVSGWHDTTPGFERSFVGVAKDFWHSEMYLLRAGELIKLEVPSNANTSVHRKWLLVKTKSPWTTGGTTWPAGALLAIHFDDFMAGQRDFTALFTPDEHTALSSYSWTRHHLILNTLKDVQNRLRVLTPQADGRWASELLAGTPSLSTVSIVETDPDSGDAYWLNVSGFLTPPTLKRGVLGAQEAETVKQAPAFFDASKFTVSQHFATSKDGTQVPYFEVAPKGIERDGSNPTLLYGYGGFGISLLPHYSGTIGRAWLEHGGVFVVANIRGGGEYGPGWHQAAMKADRPKAYQDFAAVAKDLIRRGVTSPEHLAAQGGSNGGLLVGNMLVSYPELFGAIACEVPLLDMKRYIFIAAGASWIGEYGNPEDPEQWAFIKHFSPYQLVEKGQDYPPTLFYTTTSDDRVGPGHARKMAAKMQHMGYDNVWFYENTGGGHGAGADNKQAAHSEALIYTFLWQQVQ